MLNARYGSLQQVARADPKTLVKDIEFLSHKTARQIVASAQVISRVHRALDSVYILIPVVFVFSVNNRSINDM